MISAIFAVVLLGVIGSITKFSIGHWLLFVLFIAHALIGAVELGTDGWIQNITGAILDPTQGKILFVITSLLMFGLRFCAHFIEKKVGLNPIGLLLVCSLLAILGLNFVAAVNTFGAAVGALAVYALGKTFFWPTMLAIVGDRFPATGAVAMSLMGGVGMMSAGLIGSPGLGYFKDRLAADALQDESPALYEEFKSDGDASKFLAFEAVQPINPQTLEEAKAVKPDDRTEAQQIIVAADIEGNRDTLRVDSFIPAAMAVIFLMLFFYFRSIGGYKPLSLEQMSGGVEGPVR